MGQLATTALHIPGKFIVHKFPPPPKTQPSSGELVFTYMSLCMGDTLHSILTS